VCFIVTEPCWVTISFKYALCFATCKDPTMRIGSNLEVRCRKWDRYATNIDRETLVVKSNGNMPLAVMVPGTTYTVRDQWTLQPGAETSRGTEYMRIELQVVKWIIKQRIHFNIMRRVMGWVITSVKDTRDSGRALTNTETMRHSERIRRAYRLILSFYKIVSPNRSLVQTGAFDTNVGETMTNQLSHS